MSVFSDWVMMKGDGKAAIGLPAVNATAGSDFGIALSNFGWSDSTPYGSVRDINEQSQLAISTNWNCQNGISSDCAQLPFKMLKYGVNDAGLETRHSIKDDPIARIMTRQFNPRMSAYVGRQMLQRWKIGIGNAYAEIVRDGTDTPKELYPIHPSRVPPDMAREKRKCNADIIAKAKAWNADPYSLIFAVNCDNGQRRFISERDLLWLKGPSDDGYFGMPSVALMRNSLGLDSAVMRFLKHFYQNSARPALILTSEGPINKAAREELHREFAERFENPENAGKTLITDRGLKVSSFQQSFEAMELTDLRKLSRTDIAGFYRFPLSKLMVEGVAQGWDVTHAQEASYVNDCLLNHAIPEEQEIRRQLMCEYDSFAAYPENIDPHFEMKGRMRGDDKSRAAYLQFRFNVGSISPNEIKEVEDESPSDDPNMNETYIQQGFIPLKMAGMQVQAQVDATKQLAQEPDTDDAKALLNFEKASRLGKRIANGTH